MPVNLSIGFGSGQLAKESARTQPELILGWEIPTHDRTQPDNMQPNQPKFWVGREFGSG